MKIEIRRLRIPHPNPRDTRSNVDILQYRQISSAELQTSWTNVEVVKGCEHEVSLTEYCEPCGRVNGEG